MASRLNLHEELIDILGNDRVYFQPPENILLKYPCIVYQLNTENSYYANNFTYLLKKQYAITAITTDPDSDLKERIIMHFPLSRFNRHFVSDGLYHDVINVYY